VERKPIHFLLNFLKSYAEFSVDSIGHQNARKIIGCFTFEFNNLFNHHMGFLSINNQVIICLYLGHFLYVHTCRNVFLTRSMHMCLYSLYTVFGFVLKFVSLSLESRPST
jgi:hypothetical protein